jgi:hypothetical protein
MIKLKYEKIIYSTIVLFLISFNTFRRAPTWAVNEGEFQYTMTFVGLYILMEGWPIQMIKLLYGSVVFKFDICK